MSPKAGDVAYFEGNIVEFSVESGKTIEKGDVVYVSCGKYGFVFDKRDLELEKVKYVQKKLDLQKSPVCKEKDEIGIKPLVEERKFPTKDFWKPISTEVVRNLELEYEFKEFNPMQSEVLRDKEIWNRESVLVCSPTASGKTVIGEIAIAQCVKDYKIAIYIAPTKSLCEERLEDWRKLFKGLKISILTGDYELTPAQIRELGTSDIIVMTVEMLNSRCVKINREQNNWIRSDVGCLVVDELHLLFSESRGDKLEIALMEFVKINPNAQLVLLSATLDEVQKIADWLKGLSGRKVEVYTNSYRPCKLNIHYPSYSDDLGPWDFDSRLEVFDNIFKENPEDKYLVFCPSRGDSVKLYRELKKRGIRVEYHNASLSLDKRREVERDFKEGDLQVITATPTLAVGVNLPARRVVIFGVHRGLNEISGIDIQQMVGRAGRPKYDKEGDAYIMLPASEYERQKYRVQRIDACSALGNLRNLEFHINNAIYSGRIEREEDVLRWWEMTFAKKLYGYEIDIDKAIKKLKEMDIIEEKNGFFYNTELGKVAAMLYLYPDDVIVWKKQFEKVVRENRWGDIDLCMALVHPSQIAEGEYVSKAERELVLSFYEKYRRYLPVLWSDRDLILVKYTMFNYWCLAEEGLDGVRNSIRADVDRWITAVKLIDMIERWDRQEQWDVLGLRMKYGVPVEGAELVKIRGIGRARALKLLEAGVSSLDDLRSNRQLVVELFGSKVGEKILQEL